MWACEWHVGTFKRSVDIVEIKAVHDPRAYLYTERTKCRLEIRARSEKNGRVWYAVNNPWSDLVLYFIIVCIIWY